ncbi:hypothetical protein EV363DRAFT_1324109, partial [Boletus edulis]
TDGLLASTKGTETNTRNHVTFVHDLRFTTRVPLERTGRPGNCLTPTPTPKEGQGIERRSPKTGPELYLDLGFEPIPEPPSNYSPSDVIDHAHHVRVSNLEIQSTLGQHVTSIVVQTRTTRPESPPSLSRRPYQTLSQSEMLSEPQKTNRH